MSFICSAEAFGGITYRGDFSRIITSFLCFFALKVLYFIKKYDMMYYIVLKYINNSLVLR